MKETVSVNIMNKSNIQHKKEIGEHPRNGRDNLVGIPHDVRITASYTMWSCGSESLILITQDKQSKVATSPLSLLHAWSSTTREPGTDRQTDFLLPVPGLQVQGVGRQGQGVGVRDMGW